MKELLIDWNEYQENTTSIGFRFIVLNLAEKAVLHFLLIMLVY